MIELTKKEKQEIHSLSVDFIRIHTEIIEVEETIRKMEERSSELVSELSDCRSREIEFTNNLRAKYGDGCLDCSGLKWKKLEFSSLENVEI